jgi:predicted short-subunit dehydrogenase-like oxidoreductase (DUF2520 family)
VPDQASARPARLTIGLVSAGRAGTPIAASWARAGHRIAAVSAVSAASRRRAADLLPDSAVLDPAAVASSAELLLLAVPDDVLPGLASGLAAAQVVRPGTFVVHISGAHGIEVLAPLTAAGCVPLALHPAMTFTGTALDLDRLDACPWAVTSPPALRPVAESLVVEAGGEPEWVPEAQRARYHAALSHAANHMVTLVAQAQDELGRAGVQAPRRFMAPLLSATLDNALRSGDAALTGPVARGDAATVAAHLAALADSDPATSAAYAAMATATARRAHAARMISTAHRDALLSVIAESAAQQREDG